MSDTQRKEDVITTFGGDKLQPGQWIRSIYGAVGILLDPPLIDQRANAIYAYDGTRWWHQGRKKGDRMRTMFPFFSVVPEGTEEDEYADFPCY